MDDQVMTLKQHRMAQTLSMVALVARAKEQGNKLSTQTIVSIEAGKPARMQSFRTIADALGIEPMQIREYRDAVMSNT